ncbi:MAG: hypothetical protein HZA89_09625 [Verrucomicrobia bacterium]|nr:hypothetical protein [Verrucomicrobiota bacterium]
MNATASSKTAPPLTESQWGALLKLLTDEDKNVHQTVRAKIISQGVAARERLRPHRLSSDPVLRRRVQAILDELERHAADNRFLAFCLSRGEDLDVEQGGWLLAQTQYPNIHIPAYQALLDSYAADLRERVPPDADVEAVLAALNSFLFAELKFTGNSEDYYDPDNSYLNRVMDRRLGNPISLCAVYLAVSRRLRLPVTGIGLPGHFLCRCQTAQREVYVDPFNEGRFLTKTDCAQFLRKQGVEFNEAHLAPVTPRRMLLRMCHNLHQIYASHGLAEDTARLQRYIVALGK